MRTFQIILSILSVLLVGSTLICGFWIRNSNQVTDMASSVNFHMMLGVATGISVLLTMIFSLIRK